MLDYPSDDLVAPDGVFLLARRGGTPIGCAGLRVGPNRVGPNGWGGHESLRRALRETPGNRRQASG